jgi:hypothetical protein
MATPDTSNVAQLARLIGRRDAPAIFDVRINNDHASDRRMLPAGLRHDFRSLGSFPASLAIAAAPGLFRFKIGVIQTLLACSLAGVVLHPASGAAQ